MSTNRENDCCALKGKLPSIHEFYLRGSFSDVTIRGEDEDVIFKVHSIMLAAASNVFRIIFEQDEHRRHRGFFRITGYDSSCFKTMLDFIYTGEVGQFINNAEGLLELGRDFEIENLSLAVEVELEKWLAVENAVKVLVLADEYNREKLKNIAIHFIASKMEAVASSTSWELLENRFKLCTELISSAPEDSVAKPKGRNPNGLYPPNNTNTITWVVEPEWEKYSLGNQPVQINRGEVTVWLEKFDKCVLVLQLMGIGGSILLFARTKVRGLDTTNLTIALSVRGDDQALLHKREVNFKWDRTEERELVIASFRNDCSVEYYPRRFTLTVEAYPTRFATAKHPFLRNLKVDETRFTDVVIIVDQTKFSAHKVVLASHSDYFSRMFDNGSGEYTLEDMPKDVFVLLKHWMYTDTLPHPDVVSLDVMRGAWRLQMQTVVEHCCFVLSQNLKINNATETLIAADEMKLDSLKRAARDFVAQHYQVILASRKWEAMEGRTRLIKEVILKIFVR